MESCNGPEYCIPIGRAYCGGKTEPSEDIVRQIRILLPNSNGVTGAVPIRQILSLCQSSIFYIG